MKLNFQKYEPFTLESLVLEANQDSDAASGWWLGGKGKEADGVIFIIKGNRAANKAYNLLANHGLITPGKPVVDKPKQPTPNQNTK